MTNRSKARRRRGAHRQGRNPNLAGERNIVALTDHLIEDVWPPKPSTRVAPHVDDEWEDEVA